MSTLTKKRFSSYSIEYAITNPLGKDLARIEFYSGEKKVGQALFGDAIAPGSYANLDANGEVHLYFPMTHFHNIVTILESPASTSLFVDDNGGGAGFHRGGLMTGKRRRGRTDGA